jgi:hypothetical protein
LAAQPNTSPASRTGAIMVGGQILSVTQAGTENPPPPAAKLGIYRGNGVWALDSNGNGAYDPGIDTFYSFGLAGDQVVAGDWTGNGQVRLGVFRNGFWILDLEGNRQWEPGDGVYAFGLPGDIAVVGDWNGDGRTKLGVFRCPPAGTPGVCIWVLDMAGKFAYDPATAVTLPYGLRGDQPVVSNWSGTGKVDQIGVFRNGAWIVDSNGNGIWDAADAQYAFGLAGDIAVVGNWFGGTRKRIGIFRKGSWCLDLNGSNAWEPSDTFFAFGLPGDQPAVGAW